MTVSGDNLRFDDPFLWYEFKNYLMRDARYVLSPKMKKFLDGVVDGAKRRVKEFPKDACFYRARLGHQEQKTIREQVHPLRPYEGLDIGIPPIEKRSAGRSNPLGIGYLYLATDKETAIAEVRPYKGGLVSVACFQANEMLNLVDFSSLGLKVYFLSAVGAFILQHMGAQDPAILEKILWGQMNFDFAKPISRDEIGLEYVPTQVIVEYLKESGFNGIVYNSSLTWTDGDNVVLFDDKLVQQKTGGSELVEIVQIQLEIKEYEWDKKKLIKQVLEEMHTNK